MPPLTCGVALTTWLADACARAAAAARACSARKAASCAADASACEREAVAAESSTLRSPARVRSWLSRCATSSRLATAAALSFCRFAFRDCRRWWAPTKALDESVVLVGDVLHEVVAIERRGDTPRRDQDLHHRRRGIGVEAHDALGQGGLGGRKLGLGEHQLRLVDPDRIVEHRNLGARGGVVVRALAGGGLHVDQLLLDTAHALACSGDARGGTRRRRRARAGGQPGHDNQRGTSHAERCECGGQDALPPSPRTWNVKTRHSQVRVPCLGRNARTLPRSAGGICVAPTLALPSTRATRRAAILAGGAVNGLLNPAVPGRGNPCPGMVTSVPETPSIIMSRDDTHAAHTCGNWAFACG